MAQTLAEYMALTTTPPMTKAAVYTIVRESPLIRSIPWETVGNLSVTLLENQGLPTPGFRPLNPASISEKRVPFGRRSENMKIMSDKIQVDRQFLDNKDTPINLMAANIEGYMKAVAYETANQVINGDPATNVDEPGGLVYRFKNDPRLSDGTNAPATQKRVIDGNNQASDMTLAADRNKLLNAIHEGFSIMDGGSPDIMVTNRQVILKLSEACRNATNLFRTDRDQFDRPVQSFNSIPIVDAGVKPAGVTDLTNQILPTSTTANDFISDAIYLIKWGPTMFTGIQKKPMEVIKFAEDASTFPQRTTAFEWAFGFHLVNAFSVCVIRRAA